MTNLAYRFLAGILLAGAIGAAVFSVRTGWRLAESPTEWECGDWLEAPTEGLIRLRGCNLEMLGNHNLSESASLKIRAGDDIVWLSRDPWLRGLQRRLQAAPAEERIRVRRRYAAEVAQATVVGRAERGRTFEVWCTDCARGRFQGTTDILIEEPDPSLKPILLSGVVFFVFFLPLVLLMRAQRSWRQRRRVWERAQGIVHATTDQPTAF